MGFRGRFQGSYLHREVPLVEALLPPVSIDHVLALSRLVTTFGSMLDPRVDLALVDASVGGVYHEDPFPSDTEEEASNVLVIQDTCVASKQQLS